MIHRAEIATDRQYTSADVCNGTEGTAECTLAADSTETVTVVAIGVYFTNLLAVNEATSDFAASMHVHVHRAFPTRNFTDVAEARAAAFGDQQQGVTGVCSAAAIAETAYFQNEKVFAGDMLLSITNLQRALKDATRMTPDKRFFFRGITSGFFSFDVARRFWPFQPQKLPIIFEAGELTIIFGAYSW